MSHNLIFGLGGLVVGLIGGAIGFGSLCTREARAKIKALTEQNDEMAEEIAELKAELRKKKESKAEKKEKELKSYNEYKELVGKRGYSVEDDEQETIEEKTSDILHSAAEEASDEDDQIYLISGDEYKKDLACNRKSEALTFYQEDGVLTDICDEKIHGEELLIGKEALETLADTDEKFLYVSNDIDDILYEIEVNKTDSYYRDVLGIA